MRIFITGIDGYLGWPLALYLADRGHEVGGADYFFRRRWVREVGGRSAIPVSSMKSRLRSYKRLVGIDMPFWHVDLRRYSAVEEIFKTFRPDAVVHLAECPSAPYSMIDVHHAVWVQMNNLTTTFNLLYAIRDYSPDTHLIKLGTMGEYGTPQINIPEGFFEVEYQGRRDRLPFPRQATSWYHWSKVHGSNNIMFASRIWNLRATDIMQGIVFGNRLQAHSSERDLWTRVDFDEAFGTSVHRFCCQCVARHPITIYGKGHQKRGFIPLQESVQCLAIAIESPPIAGEYRVFNQFHNVYDLTEMAAKVKKVASEIGITVELQHLDNPRVEAEDHYYNPDRKLLIELGYRPCESLDDYIRTLLCDLRVFRKRIESQAACFSPRTTWRREHRQNDTSFGHSENFPISPD